MIDWRDSRQVQAAIERHDAREPLTEDDRKIFRASLESLLKKAKSTDRQAVDFDEPRWLFRLLSGGIWEFGEEANPVRLKSIKAFADMAYTFQRVGCDISPWLLPGAPTKASKIPVYTTPHSGAFVTQGPWYGYSSDDVSDRRALIEYRIERAKIADLIEIAVATGDFAKAECLQREWKWYKREMDNSLVSGYRPRTGQEFFGKRKKLNTGDPVIKATRSARDRKKTALEKFRKAGLNEMADHIKESYRVQTRNIIYIPQKPFPKWILD